MSRHLATPTDASYLGLRSTIIPHEGTRILQMIEHRVSTLIRVSGPRVYALMGEVRPGAWVFGGDSAGARAP